MSQSKGSQPAYQNIISAAAAAAVGAGTPERGQTHWIPSGIPRNGDEYIDVACYGLVRIAPQTLTLKWQDDDFYFCSAFCRQRFAQAPCESLIARFATN